MKHKLFLNAIGDNVELANRAREILPALRGGIPGTVDLSNLTERYGVDVAASVLHQSIVNHPLHAPLINRIQHADVAAASVGPSVRIFIVPGMYYQEYPAIGASGALFRQVAERCGIAVQTVPTSSRGSIAHNSAILHEFLSGNSAEPYWLASVSRGSAEIKWLLHNKSQADYLQNLKGWVSFNGVVRGTHLIDGVIQNPLKRTIAKGVALSRRVNPVLIDEMNPQRDEWQPVRLPQDCLHLNVISIPVTWDVTERVQKRFRQLAPLGPNDGVALLGDYSREPGFLYPVAGTDHLMRTSELSSLMYRLTRVLLN